MMFLTASFFFLMTFLRLAFSTAKIVSQNAVGFRIVERYDFCCRHTDNKSCERLGDGAHLPEWTYFMCRLPQARKVGQMVCDFICCTAFNYGISNLRELTRRHSIKIEPKLNNACESSDRFNVLFHLALRVSVSSSRLTTVQWRISRPKKIIFHALDRQ